MNHHGRRGGRVLELIIMFCLITLTIYLSYKGLLISISLMELMSGGGRIPKGFLIPIAGISIGALISGILWIPFLRYYKYSTVLKPILTKAKNNAKEPQDQIVRSETKADKVKVIRDDLDELKQKLK